uniref:ATP-dependent DNA helicase n=1 Tax=Parastrongyloides trichosuri TaxID=131310 RepID=A0A0N4ZTW5_PARTI
METNNIDDIMICSDENYDFLNGISSYEEIQDRINSLNSEQREIHDEILDNIKSDLPFSTGLYPENSNMKNDIIFPKRILVDGPGGTGKSYRIKTLAQLVTYKCRKHLRGFDTKYPHVLICASTGVAASQINDSVEGRP